MNLNQIFFYIIIIALSCSSKVENQNSQMPLNASQDTIPAAKSASQRLEDEKFTVDYLMGKFDPAKHSSFVKIAPPYADNNERYLRKDAYEAFKKCILQR